MDIVKVNDGYIIIPIHIRAKLRLDAGDHIELSEHMGRLILTKISSTQSFTQDEKVEAVQVLTRV